MAYPTVKVEISLTAGDGPYTASPTWTDVTSYVRNISVNRGRTNDFEHFAPGTAQLVLSNRDNRFTPFNLSGPYVSGGVSLLTPRRQIRITATAGGAAIPVFRGYVAGWPVRWSSAGQDSTVTIDCYDSIGLLGSTDIVPDWSYQVINALTPDHWWRMNEPEGSSSFADIGVATSLTRPLTQTGTGVFTAYPTLAPGLPFRAANIPTTADYRIPPKSTGITITGSTIGFWFTPTDTTTRYFDAWFNGITLSVEPNPATAGSLRVIAGESGSTRRYVSDSTNFGAGIPHHFVATFPFGTGTYPTIYIDGQEAPFTFSSTGTYTASGDQFYLRSGVFQEVFAKATVLTATQIRQIYEAGQGVITETTGARATRLLATTSLNSARYSVAGTYEGTVSGIGNGNSLIPELQKTADSEGGDLYCDRDGVIQFTGRSYTYSQAAGSTAATFTDTGSNLPYGTELEVSYDGDNLQNDITVTIASGGSVRVTNAATTNGTASTTIDTYLSTLADATSLANLEATSGSQVVPSVSPFDVSNAGTLANWTTILGLDLLSRISITRTPTSGTTFTQPLLVTNITHDITPGQWRTTLAGTARYFGYFVLNVSKLDGTDVLA